LARPVLERSSRAELKRDAAGEKADCETIAINGLGRIGRAILKAALRHRELRVVAVNDLIDAARARAGASSMEKAWR
jgi:phosphoglycerate dehydrogenase-like enzyme